MSSDWLRIGGMPATEIATHTPSVGQQGAEVAYGREAAAARAYEQKALVAAERTAAAIGNLEAKIERQAAALERLNQDGPERTGVAAGAAMRGYGDEAARRRRLEWRS